LQNIFIIVRSKDAPLDHIVLLKGAKKCKKMSFQNFGALVFLVRDLESGYSWVRVFIEEATGKFAVINMVYFLE